MPEDFTGLSAWEMELIDGLREKRKEHLALAEDHNALDDTFHEGYHLGVMDAITQFIDILENRGR